MIPTRPRSALDVKSAAEMVVSSQTWVQSPLFYGVDPTPNVLFLARRARYTHIIFMRYILWGEGTMERCANMVFRASSSDDSSEGNNDVDMTFEAAAEFRDVLRGVHDWIALDSHALRLLPGNGGEDKTRPLLVEAVDRRLVQVLRLIVRATVAHDRDARSCFLIPHAMAPTSAVGKWVHGLRELRKKIDGHEKEKEEEEEEAGDPDCFVSFEKRTELEQEFFRAVGTRPFPASHMAKRRIDFREVTSALGRACRDNLGATTAFLLQLLCVHGHTVFEARWNRQVRARMVHLPPRGSFQYTTQDHKEMERARTWLASQGWDAAYNGATLVHTRRGALTPRAEDLTEATQRHRWVEAWDAVWCIVDESRFRASAIPFVAAWVMGGLMTLSRLHVEGKSRDGPEEFGMVMDVVVERSFSRTGDEYFLSQLDRRLCAASPSFGLSSSLRLWRRDTLTLQWTLARLIDAPHHAASGEGNAAWIRRNVTTFVRPSWNGSPITTEEARRYISVTKRCMAERMADPEVSSSRHKPPDFRNALAVLRDVVANAVQKRRWCERDNDGDGNPAEEDEEEEEEEWWNTAAFQHDFVRALPNA